jgi:hypothetical protein
VVVCVDIIKAIKAWLNFRTMMAPMLIKAIYILLNVVMVVSLVLSELWWIYFLFTHTENWAMFLSLLMMFASVVWFVIGIIMVRLLCECAIVVFGIHELLVLIEKKKT